MGESVVSLKIYKAMLSNILVSHDIDLLYIHI